MGPKVVVPTPLLRETLGEFGGADQWEEFGFRHVGIAATGLCRPTGLLDEVGTGDAQRLGEDARREPSSGSHHDMSRDSSFYPWVSGADLRISASMTRRKPMP